MTPLPRTLTAITFDKSVSHLQGGKADIHAFHFDHGHISHPVPQGRPEASSNLKASAPRQNMLQFLGQTPKNDLKYCILITAGPSALQVIIAYQVFVNKNSPIIAIGGAA